MEILINIVINIAVGLGIGYLIYLGVQKIKQNGEISEGGETGRPGMMPRDRRN